MNNCELCRQSTAGVCPTHSPFKNYTINGTNWNPTEYEEQNDILRAIDKHNYEKVLTPLSIK